MAEQLFIVTGTSRGMGEAIAHHLLQQGHLVLGIARQQSTALSIAARNRGAELMQWQADLSQPLAVAVRMREWLQGLDASRFERIHLINNAALVNTPGPVETCPLEALSGTVRVGLEAVLLLSAAFLQGSQDWAAERRILNISSGLGRRAMAGAAPYCAIKAGLDNLSKAMALDGCKVVALAPGVIDTEMQAQLRGGDPALFPEQAKFAAFKKDGLLDSPASAAQKVLRYLARQDFGAQVLADVREA
ncbi:MAG: SDR family NAD(P)-dependent oxidoreductase [Paucibacter sp.]|nr:SDR family NAD(P)-dependent oxidoreductase [Roseateles sp.]